MLYCCFASYGQTSDWIWAKNAVGKGYEIANCVKVDAFGNNYIVGHFFSDTLIFGNTTLTNKGSINDDGDIFIAKCDANGNVLWVKSAGGIGDDRAFSIALDTFGNIYIAGYYSWSPTITFDSITLTGGDYANIFLAKYNVDGNVLWVKSAGGTSNVQANSIIVDASGNIYMTGFFRSSTITFGSFTLTNSGYDDIFLTKYNTNGDVLWAKKAGGTNRDEANSVSVDALGNAYITGFFESTTFTLDTITLINTNSDTTGDIFLAKYDGNGNVIWAKNAYGINSDLAESLAIDKWGNIYMTGLSSSSSISFGSSILTNSGSYYILFLTKYDVGGNVLWAKSIGGTGYDEAKSIAIDTFGNIYVTGYFTGTTFPIGSITLTNLSHGNNENVFVAKFDNIGNVIWAVNVGGDGSARSNSVAVDDSENSYIAGFYNYYSLTFGSTSLIHYGDWDIFLAKLSNSVGITKVNDKNSIIFFPNPSNNYITIETQQTSSLDIFNLEGQLLKTIFKVGNNTTIDISDLLAGVYFIKATSEKGIIMSKFIKE